MKWDNNFCWNPLWLWTFSAFVFYSIVQLTDIQNLVLKETIIAPKCQPKEWLCHRLLASWCWSDEFSSVSIVLDSSQWKKLWSALNWPKIKILFSFNLSPQIMKTLAPVWCLLWYHPLPTPPFITPEAYSSHLDMYHKG